MYETILFPTDGSDESFAALEHALDLAETYDADLHALYVVDTSFSYGTFDGGAVDVEPVLEALREQGGRTMDRVDKRASTQGQSVVTTIREAPDVHSAILDYAADEGVDLIVVGTHGRRGLNRWLLGSVTERLVRTAEVPVLAVRHTDDAA